MPTEAATDKAVKHSNISNVVKPSHRLPLHFTAPILNLIAGRSVYPNKIRHIRLRNSIVFETEHHRGLFSIFCAENVPFLNFSRRQSKSAKRLPRLSHHFARNNSSKTAHRQHSTVRADLRVTFSAHLKAIPKKFEETGKCVAVQKCRVLPSASGIQKLLPMPRLRYPRSRCPTQPYRVYCRSDE